MGDLAGDLRVPGLQRVEMYIGPEEQRALLSTVDQLPWRKDLRRRVQHYGYRYDYRRRTVDPDMFLGPLPAWAGELAHRLQADGLAPSPFDQVIVNEYLPGQGIAHHVDCRPCFADTIASISLGSSCVLTMRRIGDGAATDILLSPGDVLVMQGEARYAWTHGIAPRTVDRHCGQVHRRDRRVSLTFRTVIV